MFPSKTFLNTALPTAPVPVPLNIIFGIVVYPVPGAVISTCAIPPFLSNTEVAVAPLPVVPDIITCGANKYPVPGFSTITLTMPLVYLLFHCEYTLLPALNKFASYGCSPLGLRYNCITVSQYAGKSKSVMSPLYGSSF